MFVLRAGESFTLPPRVYHYARNRQPTVSINASYCRRVSRGAWGLAVQCFLHAHMGHARYGMCKGVSMQVALCVSL